MKELRKLKIENDAQYHVYLREIVYLMDLVELPNASAYTSKRLVVLSKKVAAYESKRFVFKKPTEAELSAHREENKL